MHTWCYRHIQSESLEWLFTEPESLVSVDNTLSAIGLRRLHRDGIHFERLGQRDSGTLVGIISEDTMIQGYPCKKGWVHFVSEFKLLNFTASQPIENGVNVIPEDSYIRLNDRGQIAVCALPRTTEIQGHLCKGTGGPKGVHATFYPGGELHCFFAPKAVDIDGLGCKGGVFQYLQLHRNGKLKQCTLARATMINGQRFRAGTRLSFDAEGRVAAPNH